MPTRPKLGQLSFNLRLRSDSEPSMDPDSDSFLNLGADGSRRFGAARSGNEVRQAGQLGPSKPSRSLLARLGRPRRVSVSPSPPNGMALEFAQRLSLDFEEVGNDLIRSPSPFDSDAEDDDPVEPDPETDSDADISLIEMRNILQDPFVRDDSNSLKCFSSFHPDDFWSIDMRLTLLWCLASEARFRRHGPALDLWLAIIEEGRDRVDWSMWEEGDESWLRKMIVKHRMADRFRTATSKLSQSDWMLAWESLERRIENVDTTSPFKTWDTERRVLRIAWCAVTDGIPVGAEYSSLTKSINAWAHFTCPFRLSYDLDVRSRPHSRPNCSLASCEVDVWQWFKVAILDYDVDRIQDAMACCRRCVSRALPAVDIPRLFSPAEEPPVWAVILWTAFQVQSSEPRKIDDLLAIIESNTNETLGLWNWDDADEKMLRGALPSPATPEHFWSDQYPSSWQKYIDLMDAEGWASLTALTRQSSRSRLSPLEYDTAVRIGVVALWASSNSSADPSSLAMLLSLEIFLPSEPSLDNYGFLRCLLERRAPVRARHYDLNLGSEVVDWRHPRKWLNQSKVHLRSKVLEDASITSFVHVVEIMYMVHHLERALPLCFLVFIFSALLKNCENDSQLNAFRDRIHIWKMWGPLARLINFRSALSTAFEFSKLLKDEELPKALVDVALYTDIICVCAQISDILSDRVAYQDFLTAQNEQAQKLLDLIQDLLDYPLLDDRIRPVILTALMKLSIKSGLHPRCFALSERLQLDDHPVAAGSFGDVWRGLVKGATVSVKLMRVYEERDVEALLKEFHHEALIWRQLSHPNLLPFFGAYYLEGSKTRLCLVSPWMENGHIARYLKSNSVGVNRLSLVLDVALGLEYLHDMKVVHGDLKAINVLVTRSGRAVLADFGMSSVTDSKILLSTSSVKIGGTVRWQAPELFTGSRNSFASDVYAFSCVCYEIFTGTLPFHELKDFAVMFQVVHGQRPARSSKIANNIWNLMEDCWKADPKERPSAEQVVLQLRDRPICALPTDPATDWDPWCTSKFRSSLEEHTLFLPGGAIQDWVQFTRLTTDGIMRSAGPILSARTAVVAGV